MKQGASGVDPLSASQKIAKMGLSRGAAGEAGAAQQLIEPSAAEKKRDFGAIMGESSAAAVLPEDDEDSDDLF